MHKAPSVRRAPACALLVAALAAACGGHQTHTLQHDPAPPPAVPAPPPAPAAVAKDALTDAADLAGWRRAWWNAKAASALGSRDVKLRPDAAALAGLPRRAFVEALMAEPGFAETALKFGFFYLGFRRDTLRDGEALASDALALPQAVAAARAVTGKGDFLALLRLRQPLYLEPLQPASLPPPAPPPTAAAAADPKAQAAIRAQLRPLILAAAAVLPKADSADAMTTKGRVCGALYGSGPRGPGLMKGLELYGTPASLTAVIEASGRWLGGVKSYCFFGGPTVDLAERLAFVNAKLPALLDLITPLTAESYKLSSLAAIKEIDPAQLGLDPPTALTPLFYALLTNSSTNADRRRGAYILARYFCDDLTPINVAAPAAHAAGRHAADPGCQSCHYKLDPMAGFFKDIGFFGASFQGAKQILFDDGATADTAAYQAAWRAPAGAPHPWDIGYVRSAVDPGRNTYGETPADLFRIIEQAPEARQCLVKRLYQYFVGEDQALDPGYLAFLTERFNADAQTDAAAAFKNTVGRLLLGGTFSEPDAVSNACYDRAPGEPEGHAPPCRVNFILQRSCASCHAGDAAAGGLDLTGWTALADGTRSFPHQRGGQPVGRAETLTALLDRLTSTDLGQRMPLGQDMPNADREQLVRWLQDLQSPPQTPGGR